MMIDSIFLLELIKYKPALSTQMSTLFCRYMAGALTLTLLKRSYWIAKSSTKVV